MSTFRRGFVDDTENVQTGDDTSVLGGGTLRIGEVGWDGDDGVLDGLAKIVLCNFLHLAENHGGDFFRGEGLVLSVPGVSAYLSYPSAHVTGRPLTP